MESASSSTAERLEERPVVELVTPIQSSASGRTPGESHRTRRSPVYLPALAIVAVAVGLIAVGWSSGWAVRASPRQRPSSEWW